MPITNAGGNASEPQQMGDFLCGYCWTLFCTFTFRRNGSSDSHRQALERYFAALGRALHFKKGELAYFAAYETRALSALGRREVKPHWHVLLAAPHRRHITSVAEELWLARHGLATVTRYDPARGGAYYCAKAILLDECSFELSLEGLEYKGPEQLVRSWLANGSLPERLRRRLHGESARISGEGARAA